MAFSFISTQSAQACSCAEWDNADQMLQEAHAVVLAVPLSDSVVDPSAPREHSMSLPTVKTGMKIIKHFKGKYKKFFYLFSEKDNGGGNCGVEFKAHDGVYLIFAYMQNGRYYSGSCELGAVRPEDENLTRILAEISN